MTRSFPNWDGRDFPIPGNTTRFPNGGNPYSNATGDPNWDEVICLMGFEDGNGATPTDESDVSPALANITNISNAAVSTGAAKFGGGALTLDGNLDMVEWDDHADFSFGSLDFTIEMWMSKSDLSSGVFMSKYASTVPQAEWYFSHTGVNLQFLFYYGTGASSYQLITQSWAVNTNTWEHVAVDRVGHEFYLYHNGTMISSATFTGRVLKDTTEPVRIGGRDHPTPLYHKGWIDELRVTRGTGRYGGVDFTPAIQPFKRF